MAKEKEPKTKKDIIIAADDIFKALRNALPKEGNANVVVCACERLVASVLYDIMHGDNVVPKVSKMAQNILYFYDIQKKIKDEK
jgi:hypothetical protein